MNKKMSVNLGSIHVDSSDNDDDIRQKAKAHIPTALKAAGEAAAKEAWRVVEKEGKGFVDTSMSAKSKFIRSATAEFVKNASSKDQADLEESIFHQLIAEQDG